jgi:opacity protein-like surface antigen
MKKTFLALAMLTGLSNAAHADYQSFMQQPEQPYVGVDYQATRIDAGTTVDLGSIMLRAGTQIAPYIGVEAQYSYGVKDDDFIGANGATYTAKNRGSYGLFVRPSYQLQNNLTAYGLIGANYIDINVDGPNGSNSYGTSFAAGAGLTLMTSDTFGFGAEYMHYDTDVDAINLGLRFMF